MHIPHTYRHMYKCNRYFFFIWQHNTSTPIWNATICDLFFLTHTQWNFNGVGDLFDFLVYKCYNLINAHMKFVFYANVFISINESLGSFILNVVTNSNKIYLNQLVK